MSNTFSPLPDESSWAYRAGVAWLVFAGIVGLFTLLFALIIVGLPFAIASFPVLLAAILFGNSFLSYQSVRGAMVASIAAGLLAEVMALGGGYGMAVPFVLLWAVSILGLRDLARQRTARRN